MTSQPPSYRGYRFPPEIISHAVWLYHRFGLSFRDVEDLLAERGVTPVSSRHGGSAPFGRLTINFACDPARTESLVRAAFQVIDRFKRNGPSEGQIADARAALMRDFETNSQQNAYLLSRIIFKYEYDEDVADIFNMRPFYDQLSAPVLRDAARAYLNTDRYVKVTLRPE